MLNRFMMICCTSCANVLYLHVRIFLSENIKRNWGNKMPGKSSHADRNLSDTEKHQGSSMWWWMSILVQSWGNKWPYFHWETPKVGWCCCSWDLLEPAWGANGKFKLTDNSHLVSSKIGTMEENVSCEKRAIAQEHNCIKDIRVPEHPSGCRCVVPFVRNRDWRPSSNTSLWFHKKKQPMTQQQMACLQYLHCENFLWS